EEGLARLRHVRVSTLAIDQPTHVALMPALAAKPKVLLLYERLAASDVASAERWRRFFHATATDRSTVMITHNALDIARLSHNMAVVEGGRVIACGPTGDILTVPPTAFVADLAGLNRLNGTIESVDSDGYAVFTTNIQDIHGVLEITPSAAISESDGQEL